MEELQWQASTILQVTMETSINYAEELEGAAQQEEAVNLKPFYLVLSE